jgi:hypothetical protein
LPTPWAELRSENEINGIAYPKELQKKTFTSCNTKTTNLQFQNVTKKKKKKTHQPQSF